MKRMIFHIPFEPNVEQASASQLRPIKMIEAFRNVGYDVTVVSGYGDKRAHIIMEIKNQIKQGTQYDFVYSESSTMPTLLTEKHHIPTYPFLDFSFFRFCKKNNIPIGLFYRDIHWKFEQYRIPFWKKIYASFFYQVDLFLYNKIIDVLFLPSLIMKSYIPEITIHNIVELPPGCDIVSDSLKSIKKTNNKIKLLYVGGIGRLYDLKLFLEVVAKEEFNNIYFTICCRKQDFDNIRHEYEHFLEHKRISIVHLKGHDLQKLYSTHDVCCLYVKPIEYWKFAMPVKLFEYISHKKPIIGVKGTSSGDFVENNRIGWSIPFEYNALFQLCMNLQKSDGLQISNFPNIDNCFAENTWNSRAILVENSLMRTRFKDIFL
ncbi:glycosyltransferase [Olivibacter sp. SA151]|uniref:glycosyltransferase n=1 Tax=Olivibacter jilunii TaxID=985016 RepID=UPI003F15BE0C